MIGRLDVLMVLVVSGSLVGGAGAHGAYVAKGDGYELWWGEPSHVYVHLDGATFGSLAKPGTGWLLAWSLAGPIEQALIDEHAARPTANGQWYCDGVPVYVQPVPCRVRIAVELQAHVEAGDDDVHFDRHFGFAGAFPLG